MQRAGRRDKKVSNEVANRTRRFQRNKAVEVFRPSSDFDVIDGHSPLPERPSRPHTAVAERILEQVEEERVESRCASALPGPERRRLSRRSQSPLGREQSKTGSSLFQMWDTEESKSRISDTDMQDILNDDLDTDLEGEEEVTSFDRTGRAAYVRMCQRAGVVPANFFLRHMTEECLEMRHHGLGASGMRTICASLMGNSHVRHLDVSDNWLGRSGGMAVAQMLQENCFITHVTLNDNQLDKEVAIALAEAISVNPQISHMTLRGNFFDDTAAEALADIILNTVRLEMLDLSHNQLGDRCGEKIGEALADNTTLLDVNLSWNHMKSRGAKGLAKALMVNRTLLRLNVGWNAFGPVLGVQELGKALRTNVTLEELDLSNNRITPEGAVLLGKGLSANMGLQKLIMGKNPLQSAGCFAVVSAVMKNPQSRLKSIQFQNIWVNQDFRDLQEQAIAVFPELKISTGLHVPTRPKARVHPLIRLLNYKDKHDMKLIDFFRKFDKNGDMTLSHEEFMQGMQLLIATTGLNFTSEDVAWLIRDLDKDGDGEINYSELVMSKAEFEESERKGKLLPARFTSM